MIIRIWRVDINAGRADALEKFANEISLPMLRAQPGCLAIIFSRSDRGCATITLWDKSESIARAEVTTEYRSVVRQIEESGIVGDNHHTEVYRVYGGHLKPELASLLAVS